MKKVFLVLVAMIALSSVGFAKSVREELPASWQACAIDGFPPDLSLFAWMSVGEIFDEENLITKEDVKNGGTYGVLRNFLVVPEHDAAIFAYELWVVSNKAGMEGETKKIADIYLTLMFFPDDESAIIYALEVEQASTGITKSFAYDNYFHDEEMMTRAAEPFLKMMIKTE